MIAARTFASYACVTGADGPGAGAAKDAPIAPPSASRAAAATAARILSFMGLALPAAPNGADGQKRGDACRVDQAS